MQGIRKWFQYLVRVSTKIFRPRMVKMWCIFSETLVPQLGKEALFSCIRNCLRSRLLRLGYNAGRQHPLIKIQFPLYRIGTQIGTRLGHLHIRPRGQLMVLSYFRSNSAIA